MPMTSRFCYLPSIVEVEARANQLASTLVRWADGKTTGHSSPEFQSDFTLVTYQPVLTPPTSANRRRGGPVEQKP